MSATWEAIDVIQDPELGARIAAIEREVADRHRIELERARSRIRETIEQRYPTSSSSAEPSAAR